MEITGKMVELVCELQDDLLLVGPALEWVRQKKAELAAAKLNVLYTPEQLEAMKAELK